LTHIFVVGSFATHLGILSEPALRSRFPVFLISCSCATAAASCGCGSLDLQATTLQESTPDNSNQNITSPTFYVSGRRLRDPCGKSVVLRGVNEMVTYISNKSGAAAFSEIARTNANSVRIYWRTSDSATELDAVLRDAEAQRLVPIVYVLNGARDQDRFDETSVLDAAKYWTQTDVASVVEAHKSWLIIALREKSDESSTSVASWSSRYGEAIALMRSAGMKLPLAIDAPLEGSDMQTLLDAGEALIAKADSLRNLLLNVNVGLSSDPPEVLATQLIAAAASPLELPILIGEISGYSHWPDYSCRDVYAFSTILAAAQQTETGWLAWSWGTAGNQPCRELDMAPGGLYDSLQGWGLEAARLDQNSIERTAVKPSYVPGASCD
jgi:mannan endo-1,4-beta-mannosidase